MVNVSDMNPVFFLGKIAGIHGEDIRKVEQKKTLGKDDVTET